MERAGDTATLGVEPFRSFTPDERTAVADEGERLLAFLAPEPAERAVRIARQLVADRS